VNNKEPSILNNDTLEKELLFIWRKTLDNDQLTIDDDFFEAGGDSLLAIQMLLKIEQLTGQSFSLSVIFETGTIRQLLKRVGSTDEFQPRVSFLTGPDDGKMIHFFHGDYETGGPFVKPFSRKLGDDYLIHAITPHLPHEGKLPDSIEEMAKERVQIIIEKQPEGPYIILGNCNGALVGFEAARQLISMGKEVKGVVMLDPTIVSVRRHAQFIFITADFFMCLLGIDKIKRRDKIIAIWHGLLRLDRSTKDFWHRCLFFLKKTWPEKQASLKKRAGFYSVFLHPEKLINKLRKRENMEEMESYYTHSLLDYNPLPLNVPLLYVSIEFGGYAWRRITRNTVYMNIHRGNHFWSGEKYAQDIADKIRDFINR
jgi:oxalate---CoA ligase